MITPTLLSASPIFAGLSEEQLTAFVMLAEDVTCMAGEALFREGEEASRLYVLINGRVSVQVQPTSLNQPLTIVTLGTPGQLVGWSGFMPPHYYTAAAVCQERSQLAAFNGVAFNRLLDDDPALGLTIMRRIAEVISERLRNTQRIVLKTLYQSDQ